MNLEDELRARQQAIAAGRRIEARGSDCLTFGELSAEALSARQDRHVSSCERCRTLRERLRASVTSDPQTELDCSAPQRPARRSRRALRFLMPLASAACLVLAAWLAFLRPPPLPTAPDERLHRKILDSTQVVDGVLRVLGDQSRTGSDVSALEAENDALRLELKRVIEYLEDLLEAARAVSEDEGAPPTGSGQASTGSG